MDSLLLMFWDSTMVPYTKVNMLMLFILLLILILEDGTDMLS
jgi:hypothetical protein